MKITEPGTYRLAQDWSSRGSQSIRQFNKGSILEMSWVDKTGRKVIGPQLLDWAPYDIPVEPVANAYAVARGAGKGGVK